MRLRLTVGLLALLLLALVLAGGASLFLVRQAATSDARDTVRRETVRLVAEATQLVGPKGCTPTAGSPDTSAKCPTFAELLPALKSIAGISEAAILVVDEKGMIIGENSTGLPNAVLESGPTEHLAAGHVIDGTYRGSAYAAAPLTSASGLTVALVLVVPIRDTSASVSYFLLAGAISLVVVAALAIVATSRVSRRVVAAAATAERITAGDFGARVPVESRDLPELRALSGAINSMAASLEQARALERRFLLSISHDLRTPLTAIRGYAEAIADGATPEPAAAAEVIIAQSDRLQRLIADLLQLARLEARQFELDLESIDLAGVVRASTEALALAFASAGVALAIETPSEQVPVYADAHRVQQIVANLLENALHFAGHEVRVTVTVAAESDAALVFVDDDGPGIEPDDLPRVFDPLFTSLHAGARPVGTGLGLAIVAELAGAMSMTVTVDSPRSDDGGTRFVLRGPLEHLA